MVLSGYARAASALIKSRNAKFTDGSGRKNSLSGSEKRIRSEETFELFRQIKEAAKKLGGRTFLLRNLVRVRVNYDLLFVGESERSEYRDKAEGRLRQHSIQALNDLCDFELVSLMDVDDDVYEITELGVLLLDYLDAVDRASLAKQAVAFEALTSALHPKLIAAE